MVWGILKQNCQEERTSAIKELTEKKFAQFS